jgi:pimeloyl-ACP methyl ester carboxylesterase
MAVQAQQELRHIGGAGVPLVFLHANGFPPGSYRSLLSELFDVARVSTLDLRPLWGGPSPRGRTSWSDFALDVASALKSAREPVWLMGHSLGAVVSALTALHSPQCVRGLILLDPVFLRTRTVAVLRLLPQRVRQRLPLVRRALGRPDQFESLEAAFVFHRQRRALAGLSDQVLWDYLRDGTHLDAATGVLRLRYPKAWEAAIYQAAPWIWPKLNRLRQPTLGLRGLNSDVLSESAYWRWGSLQPAVCLKTVAGGHLFPLEQPEATSHLVKDFLRSVA